MLGVPKKVTLEILICTGTLAWEVCVSYLPLSNDITPTQIPPPATISYGVETSQPQKPGHKLSPPGQTEALRDALLGNRQESKD